MARSRRELSGRLPPNSCWPVLDIALGLATFGGSLICATKMVEVSDRCSALYLVSMMSGNHNCYYEDLYNVIQSNISSQRVPADRWYGGSESLDRYNRVERRQMTAIADSVRCRRAVPHGVHGPQSADLTVFTSEGWAGCSHMACEQDPWLMLRKRPPHKRSFRRLPTC